MEQFVDRIRSICPLNSLGPQELETLMSSAEDMRLKRDDVLFEHGSMDNNAFYLLDGELSSEHSDGTVRTITVESDAANYAIGNLQPRPYSVRVASNTAIVLRLDRSEVEKLVARSQMVTGEMPAVSVMDVSGGNQADGAWMFKIIQSEIFRELPTENIARFFSAIERLETNAQDVIVRQGDIGDYYYMIVEGEATVARKAGPVEMPLSELAAGDSFGEEAVISGLPRNASVKMKTDGVLMRLSKDDFVELIKRPTIRSTNAGSAAKQVKDGIARLIDVRLENEHGKTAIRGSLNIPLYKLRDQLDNLERDISYIFYCDSGARSSVAAYLLSERGFNASFLKGGLSALVPSS